MRTVRPLITGLGVVAPTGVGVAEHWAATLEGRCGLRPIVVDDAAGPPFPVAGRVPDFDVDAYVPRRLKVQTDRWTWMALAATRMALDDAGLDPSRHDPYALAVVTASGSGGNEFGQREIQALYSTGAQAVSAYQSIGWFYAASTGRLSILHQLKGPCGVIMADGAGGLDAAAQACRLIRRGTAAVVVGGTEAPLSPYALVCQAGRPGSSTEPDPGSAYRPFDRRACGDVPGEGGAMLILEDPARVSPRDAYAELAGASSTHDAHSTFGPPRDHRQLARAMREAIARADCTPQDVDVVFADGAGDPWRDELEAAAIGQVFEGASVPVTVPKTMTGRLCSGGAALDLVWAALALRHDTIPPTVNVEPGHDLDVVTRPRRGTGLRTALVVARGTGGFNSAAVLRRVV
ncbi:beta-ketoacyl synthase N-terminal-like domain-containing protein [Thermomonospora umbrina]|uniref:Minimal PKS chain-length factor (CLF/KS beta) n=1 Tax=Thermomonospora umbrina TaxID=111806 RepID=A0A3D9T177_9ACTN|nr:beta-ketoacyl synthase N-terminal-like domain-containing protein [Thermomonospora umbrina]REE97571.1 minimal PKS chain-length factor (CLF/KS beta) [Thermomonospora umbrina]